MARRARKKKWGVGCLRKLKVPETGGFLLLFLCGFFLFFVNARVSAI
jgi:hypothetical protein